MKCDLSSELKEVINDEKTFKSFMIIRLNEIENKVEKTQNEIKIIKKVAIAVVSIIAGLLGFQIQI